MPGDICILGSDGLFDNVSEEEMLEEVTNWPKILCVCLCCIAAGIGSSYYCCPLQRSMLFPSRGSGLARLLDPDGCLQLSTLLHQPSRPWRLLLT